MIVILFNFSWMFFNLILAFIAVCLGFLFLFTANKLEKSIYAFFWLLFLPNTAYLYTDLINLIHQWGRYNNSERLVLLFQYGALEIMCVITTVLALYPFERYILGSNHIKRRISPTNAIILINFVVGFGITLGRVERINSWDLLFALDKVLGAGFRIISSPRLLLLTILFGLISNFIYFLFRRPVIRQFKIYLSRVGVKV